MTATARSRQETGTAHSFDVEEVRRDFPGLHQEVHGHPLVYLDNAASAQKPQSVLDALLSIYRDDYANVHRGVHTLSQRATDRYEAARETCRRSLGASRHEECVFVRGATEGINLVAHSFARPRLQPGDEVLVTQMEHHSNLVPWQMVCRQAKAKLRWIPLLEDGSLDLDRYRSLLSERTKMIALVHISNALGTINPIREICRLAREKGVPVLVDGAQAAPHSKIDVEDLGCDFYVISGHKVFGPTGIGVLWGRHELLSAMPPYQGGGEMITNVTMESSDFHVPPHRFEAGTPHIAGAVGLAAALEYVSRVGWEAIAQHEHRLLTAATRRLAAIDGVELVGTAPDKAAVVSFTVQGVHPHDIGTILDHEGVAVRAGHHCAQPIADHYGVAATTRASFAFYNTLDEVERLGRGIETVLDMFGDPNP
ncbi:MAG: cysteine desulfurase [Thermoanaerobaculia bacterium]|nr:cysteine desulfurase [Thermoanaerobaculia bacterium]